jgi:hypothetical protein
MNYETKNLFIATYLMVTNQVQFLGLRQLDSKTKLFVFSPANLANQLEAEYFSGASSPAKLLFAEYNNLKDLLFQREANGEKYDHRSK